MQPFTVLPLLTCLLAAAAAAAVLARGYGERINQLTAAMLACGAHWALCEAVWNNLEDAAWVERTIRISGFGWVPLGALVLHLVLEAQDDTRSWLRRLLPLAYAAAAAGQVVYLFSPDALTSVSRTGWGWVYSFGPAFPWVVTPTVFFAVAGIGRWRNALPAAETELERRQGRQVLLGMGLTLVVALTTDVVFPHLGLGFPRLGSISVIVFCGFVAWGVTRHDYFVLAPGLLAQRILDSLHEGAALLSADERVIAANDALARLVGLPPERVRGASLRDFVPELVEVDLQALDVFETDVETPDGGRTPVALSSAILHDKKGRALGSVVSMRDLRDVAAMRDRVMTAGRLAAVGELAAGVVHEISNPVAWMRTNLSSLRDTWEQMAKPLEAAQAGPELGEVVAEGAELIDECIEGVDRIARLVSSVRSFSHAGQGERELADVNALLESSIAMAAPKLRQCVATLEPDLGHVSALVCSPQELKQLFLNLLINAANAVQPGGRIRVVTRPDAGRVLVRIEDDGCGMSPQQVRGVFEPVFRSRTHDGGFAIGLPACHEIVRKHGGEIAIDSALGSGTVFRIALPCEADPPEAA
jgi:PAS domain S-box-containing protein